MEAYDHHSSAGGDFEQVSANNPDADQQKSKCAEQLILIELDALKSENKLLHEKNNTLVAKVDSLQVQLLVNNREMQARLESMEQKLKIAELETKLAKQQEVHTENELFRVEIGIMKLLLDALTAKVETLQGQNGELQIKQKVIELETKLAEEQKAKAAIEAKMGEEIAELKEEQRKSTADGLCKTEKGWKTVDAVKLTKLEWSNNHWHIFDQERVQASADGLSVANAIPEDHGTNVRAYQPVSLALLALIPGQKLVYWEVQMKKERAACIGWVGPNFSLNGEWIGEYPGSFAITHVGSYWESGRKVQGYSKGFGVDDVVGTGLTRGGKLFFTRNGALNGELIFLNYGPDILLYPAVTLYRKEVSVEINFGADLAGKPFKFDINAHEAQLFD